MNIKPLELKERVINFIYELYRLGSPSRKQLILVESDIADETDCPATKINPIIESLKSEGLLTEVTVGYVPGETVPTSHAVFTSSKSLDCPCIGYKIIINRPKLEKIGSVLNTKFTDNTTANAVEFDSLNGVVRYGTHTHKFHEGTNRRLLFVTLWNERKHLKGGKEILKGMVLPLATCAIRIKLIDVTKDYNNSKNKFSSLVKGINRSFVEKNIPARIVQENGVQLVVTD